MPFFAYIYFNFLGTCHKNGSTWHAVVYILHPKNGNKASKHQAEMTIL